MTNKEFVLDTMRRQGRDAALVLQEKSSDMTGTEGTLYAAGGAGGIVFCGVCENIQLVLQIHSIT